MDYEKIKYCSWASTQNGTFGPEHEELQPLTTRTPVSALLRGIQNTAHAQDASSVQYLIMISGSASSPFNANTPDSDVDGVVNNPNSALAPTEFLLSGQQTVAAAPWAGLSEWTLSQIEFIHHRRTH